MARRPGFFPIMIASFAMTVTVTLSAHYAAPVQEVVRT
jgi:hypothetical protein